MLLFIIRDFIADPADGQSHSVWLKFLLSRKCVIPCIGPMLADFDACERLSERGSGKLRGQRARSSRDRSTPLTFVSGPGIALSPIDALPYRGMRTLQSTNEIR